MSARRYLAVSGSVFAVVAVLHLIRVVSGWSVEVGQWSAPMEVSWFGTVFPAVLCAWAFRLVSRTRA